MLIGAHVSIAGGLDLAIDRGAALGANCIQTFASSPRSMKWTPYSQAAIQTYLIKKAKSPIKVHVFHGIYLINLATEKTDYLEVCTQGLIHYQQLAGEIGALGTVFHIGSHKGRGLAAVLNQVATAIASVCQATPRGAVLILENAAGQAGVIGDTFEDLQLIFNRAIELGADKDKLGLCFDTQHAFASGYDMRTQKGADQVLRTIDRIFGLDRLQVIHVNDSLVEAGSKRDRHANVGEGMLGTAGIAHLLNHPELHHIPFILEVPGAKHSGPRAEDVAGLLALTHHEPPSYTETPLALD